MEFFYTAGITTPETIEKVDRGYCESHFATKVNGLFVLDKIIGDRTLDFCLLTSSLSAVLGGLGFIGYSAANLFMDAFSGWKK